MANPEFLLVEVDLNVPGNQIQSVKDTIALAEATQILNVQGQPDFDVAGDDVRRPMRGIQLKEETFASLFLHGQAGAPTIYNSSAPPEEEVVYTTNFILQSVQESRQEKFQPVTTFGATYGFFFGEQPRMVNFQAILLNTADFQWEIEWWSNYEEFARGTRLADRQVRCYLTFDDQLVEGYITGASTSKNAQEPHMVNLSFQMWVTGVEYLITPGEKEFPETSEETIVDFTGLDSFQNEVGDFVSTTSEVRSRNITITATSGGGGFFAKLGAALDKVGDFFDKVGQAIDDLFSWLHGRNLVIPAGFAGSDRIVGSPLFVDGAGNVVSIKQGEFDPNNLGQLQTALSVKLPPLLGQSLAPKTRTFIYDNIDEYPKRSGRTNYDRKTRDLAELRTIVQGAVAVEDVDMMATKAAESAFLGFGIKVTNIEGKSQSALSLMAGRSAYAAINLAASASGASQAAASLTVGNVLGGGTLSQDIEDRALETQ